MNGLKKSAFIFFCIFIFSSGSCFAVDSLRVDSLVKAISESTDDTNKVKMLMSLSRQYSGNDEDKVVGYLEQALILSSRLGYTTGQAKALSQMGTHYFRIAQYPEAITASLKAISLFTITGDRNGIASAYSNIGNINLQLKDYENAMEYLHYALNIQKELNSERAEVNTLCTMGEIFMKLEQFDSAQVYLEAALKIQKNLKSENSLARICENLGSLYIALNDTDLAMNYLSDAEAIYTKRKNFRGLANVYCILGKVNSGNKSYDEAALYFQKSLTLAEKAESQETIEEAYFGLAEVYEKMNRFSDALKYYKLYNAWEDSVFDINRNKLIEMQNRLDSEKKESTITLQNTWLEKSKAEIARQNTLVVAMIIGVLLLIALTALSYNSYKRKKRDHDLIAIEKKKSEDLLLNILPEEIADELKQNGKSQAKKIDLVTVLFADFIGFSKFAEMLDPERVVQELDYYFQAFDTIVHKYDIEKIKTMGDAYMCAGGVPGVNQSNPLDVVSCGIEMRDFVEQYKQQQAASGKLFLEMRIGIHTGPVVAGIVGVKKFSYDIWGDTVNVASRLQSTGKEGKVNISEATFQYVKNDFKCEYRGKLPVKNLGEIDMYFAEPLKSPEQWSSGRKMNRVV